MTRIEKIGLYFVIVGSGIFSRTETYGVYMGGIIVLIGYILFVDGAQILEYVKKKGWIV